MNSRSSASNLLQNNVVLSPKNGINLDMDNIQNSMINNLKSNTVILTRSPRSGKKWRARVQNKSVDFGQAGAEDYTIHKDIDRRERYWKRHAGIGPDYLQSNRENWSDPKTAGFWSRWLTWNKPTIDESIKDIEKRFNFKIIK